MKLPIWTGTASVLVAVALLAAFVRWNAQSCAAIITVSKPLRCSGILIPDDEMSARKIGNRFPQEIHSLTAD